MGTVAFLLAPFVFCVFAPEINNDEIEREKRNCQISHRPVPEHHTSSMINLARIHDKYGLKKYWEEKIKSHEQRMGNEVSRMKNSALSKLREEWVQRLQFRNQHVIESMREQQIRRAQRVQGILKV